MVAKINFYMTRHGKTLLNTLEKVQGWSDSPLTEEGRNVAAYLGRGLDIAFDAVYTSDRGRTIETADIILTESKQTHLKKNSLLDLREFCFGKFEGTPNEEMFGTVMRHLGFETTEEGMMNLGPKGFQLVAEAVSELDETGLSESWAVMEARLLRALDQMIEEQTGDSEKHVLVVTHGMTINSYLTILAPELVDPFIENASITKMVYENGEIRVESVNDTHYILAGQKV